MRFEELQVGTIFKDNPEVAPARSVQWIVTVVRDNSFTCKVYSGFSGDKEPEYHIERTHCDLFVITGHKKQLTRDNLLSGYEI